MCSLCMRTPCHPRCPNAPEPEPIMRCIECGEGIFEDDKYYDSCSGAICKECMDDKNTSELMELFGEEFSTAYAY